MSTNIYDMLFIVATGQGASADTSYIQGLAQFVIWITIIVYISFPLVRRSLERFSSGSFVDAPILLSYYTKGNGLQQMSEGVISGVRYNLVITTESKVKYDSIAVPAGFLIYRIELPFHTQAHIVGINSRAQMGTGIGMGPELASNNMERVNLEGNFDKFFAVYAPKGQQMQTRYVFDPMAMEFTIKYCASFHWEIVGDELYFVPVQGAETRGSSAQVIKHAGDFINQIRPALISQLAGHHLPGKAPYGEYRGKGMNCPVCNDALIDEKHWFRCPKDHGRLIGGRELLAVREGSITSDVDRTSVLPRADSLFCPSCGQAMIVTDYQSMGIMIDSCSKCHYRWCDAGELSKIAM